MSDSDITDRPICCCFASECHNTTLCQSEINVATIHVLQWHYKGLSCVHMNAVVPKPLSQNLAYFY